MANLVLVAVVAVDFLAGIPGVLSLAAICIADATAYARSPLVLRSPVVKIALVGLAVLPSVRPTASAVCSSHPGHVGPTGAEAAAVADSSAVVLPWAEVA